jgi:sulfoxide reductase heme-binding subunit YedZ
LITLKKFRRHLGVAGWTYLAVHIAFHFVMEAGILEGVDAIWHAQYLWLGAAAASCITLLAITSNNLSQKLLGRYWTYLHRSVYIAFILAILHTLLIEKADTPHFSAIAILFGS